MGKRGYGLFDEEIIMVLSCFRRNCPNIMCNRYSDKYGYICASCFEELEQAPIDINIVDFMDSEPGTFLQECRDYNKIFPIME